jgi:hypothetical protein
MTLGRTIRAAFLPLLALPLLVARCGGGGGGPAPTVASFCEDLAEAECQVVGRCATVTMDACVAQRSSVCMTFATQAQAGGIRVFTPGNMGDCINRTRAAYGSSNPITPSTLAEIERACNYVFQGSKMMLSDACANRYECAGTTNGTVVCDKDLCAMASAPKAAGMPCSDPGATCVMGNYCTQNMAGVFVCTARVNTGGTCNDTTPCLENLRCMAGSCAERASAGGPCSSSGDCGVSAPYCDPFAGNICTSGLLFAPNSPSCQAFGGMQQPTGAGGTGGGGGGSGGGGGGGGAAGAGGGNADASLD